MDAEAVAKDGICKAPFQSRGSVWQQGSAAPPTSEFLWVWSCIPALLRMRTAPVKSEKKHDSRGESAPRSHTRTKTSLAALA